MRRWQKDILIWEILWLNPIISTIPPIQGNSFKSIIFFINNFWMSWLGSYRKNLSKSLNIYSHAAYLFWDFLLKSWNGHQPLPLKQVISNCTQLGQNITPPQFQTTANHAYLHLIFMLNCIRKTMSKVHSWPTNRKSIVGKN